MENPYFGNFEAMYAGCLKTTVVLNKVTEGQQAIRGSPLPGSQVDTTGNIIRLLWLRFYVFLLSCKATGRVQLQKEQGAPSNSPPD
jgi:hypothetical protein